MTTFTRFLLSLARRQSYASSAARHGDIYSTSHGLYAIPKGDAVIGAHLRSGKHWGADELAEIEAVTNENSRVLVVGAHIGTLAIPIANKVSHVTAIEANPVTFRYLSANVALNGIQNIQLHQLAAGEKQGSIDFLASVENTGGSKRAPKIRDERYFFDNPKTIKVPMDRLDNLLEANYDTIVMDIEGSEYFALLGMRRILTNAKRLLIEFLPHHLRNVSGASVEDLLSAIGEDFLILRSLGNTYEGGHAIRTFLEGLFEADKEDPSLYFCKPLMSDG